MSVLRWAGRLWIGVLLVTTLLVVLLVGLRLVLPLVATPPTLVATIPAGGAAGVSPRDAAVLRFSVPMNPASVERALRFEPPFSALFRWSDDYTTLTISPTATLRTNTRYTVTVGAQAFSRLFRPLSQPAQIAFTTSSAPAVVATIPADGAQNVPVDMPISMSFSRAVVPATEVALPGNLPQLQFDPPLSGMTTWLNQQTALFRPSEPLQSGTRYTATLAAGLVDQTGAQIIEPFSWNFSTPAPSVLTTVPRDEAQGIASRAPVVLRLSQPFDSAAVQSHFSISPSIDLAMSAATLPDATQVVTWTPTADWQPDTTYTAMLRGGLSPVVGNLVLAESRTWHFRTAPQPQVIARFPGEGQTLPSGQDIRLIFNTPVDGEALRAALHFVPDAANVRVMTQGAEARIAADLHAATTYTMTLAPSLHDLNGLPLSQTYQLRFVSPPAEPALELAGASNHMLQLPSSSGELVITRTNLSALSVDLFQLDEPTVVRVADFSDGDWTQFSPERYNQRLMRSWREAVADPLNTPTAARMPLVDGNGAPLQPGAYFVRMRTPEGPRADVLLLLSRARLTWQQGRTGALVWATDVISGTPLGALPLAVYHQGALVQRGATDANGMWHVIAPDSAQQPSIVVAAGGASFVNSSRQIAPPAAAPPRFQAFLTTDRSTYRPGDQVALAGFVRATAGESLVLPRAGTPVEFSARQTQTSSRAYEATAALSSTGVLSAAFRLAPNALPGDYLLSARIGDDTFTTHFAVQTTDAPLDVAVRVPQRVIAGAPVTAQVAVQTPEGFPVADAAVAWTLRVEPVPAIPLAGYEVGSPEQAAARTLRTGTAQTDGAGRMTVPITETARLNPTALRYQVLVTATEPHGLLASAQTTFLVEPASVRVGMHLPSRVWLARQPQTLELFTAALDGTPAPQISMRAEAFRQTSGTEPDERVLAQSLVTDDTGHAALPMALPRGGVYHLVVTAIDANGREITVIRMVWVAEPGFTGWSGDRIQLIPDRDTYQPGDTATLLATMPFESATALIAVQHGAQIQGETRLIHAGDLITVPLALDDHSPVQVGMEMIDRSPNHAAFAALADATATLPMQQPERALSVTVSLDRASYAPESTAQVVVKTTDANGHGVPSDVVLDLASAGAAPRNDLMIAFTGRPPAPERPDMPAATAATSYWNPALQTDASGMLTVTVPLPSEAGALHATAWAARRDLGRLNVAGFGQAQQTLLIMRPLQLNLILPEHLRMGDMIDVAARIQNTSATTQSVRMVLTTTGLRMRDDLPATQVITLASGADQIVRWPATVRAAAGASLSVSAHVSTGDTMTVTQSRPIEPLSASVQSEGGLLVEDQGSLTFDADTQQPGAQLVVEVAPSAAALARGTLATLAAQPDHSTLDDASMLFISDSVSNTRALAQPALERVLATQQLDGTWGWWRGSPSNPFITASVLEALAAARHAGLPVPQDAVQRGLDSLGLTADPSPTLQAYIAYVRALHGQTDEAAITALARDSAALGNEGVAYLLLAGASGDVRDALVTYLSNQPLRDVHGAFWSASGTDDVWSTRTSTTALAVLALQKARGEEAVLPDAQAWLAAQRGVGGWGDSWSSARALAALQVTEHAAGHVDITLNGAPLFTLDSSQPITSTRQITVPEDLIRPRNTLAASGGPAFMSYRLLVPGVPSTQEGVGLLREYLDPQTGAPIDLNTVQAGQLMRVRLTLVTNRALRFVTLRDTLPGGARLVSAGKGTWEHVASADGQVFLASTALPPGIYEHTYLARAIVPGMFAAPPVRVSSADELIGAGRTTTMIVTPQ